MYISFSGLRGMVNHRQNQDSYDYMIDWCNRWRRNNNYAHGVRCVPPWDRILHGGLPLVEEAYGDYTDCDARQRQLRCPTTAPQWRHGTPSSGEFGAFGRTLPFSKSGFIRGNVLPYVLFRAQDSQHTWLALHINRDRTRGPEQRAPPTNFSWNLKTPSS